MKASYRLIMFILLIIGSSLIYASAYAAIITCNTLVADNSTDNTAALNTCLNAAKNEPEKIVNIPSAGASSFKFNSTITVPAGVSVVGADGAKFNLRPGLVLKDYSKITNIDFVNTGGYITVQIGTAGGGLVTGAEINDCSFGGSNWSTILAWVANECIINNNTITNTGTGQNICFLGGKRNRITNNKTNGGFTGIILKYDRRHNTSPDGMFEDNIIAYNNVGPHQEEGISLDSNAAISASTPELEYDTVSAVNGASITLSNVNWGGGDDPDYVGYYIVPCTGSAIGQYKKIMAQSGATFTVESAFSDLVPGDGVSINALYIGNVIAHNTVTGGFRADRILIYGSAFHNRIEYNDVGIASENGITIKSLDRGPVSNISVTGAAGRGPAGYNLIRNNTANAIYVRYRCNGAAGSYSPYNSYGNALVNNTITGKVTINYQYYYSSGNTGGFSLFETGANDCSGTTSSYAVALDSTPLDTTDQTYTDYVEGIAKLDPPSGVRIETIDDSSK
ncbi:MAG: hypothetical protein KJ737_22215 [Proteobacteria bacterium]|nr:hypothetical protein [Pseudomonadota bacterium]